MSGPTNEDWMDFKIIKVSYKHIGTSSIKEPWRVKKRGKKISCLSITQR